MKTYADVKVGDSTFEISLSRLTDQKIKDVNGYISEEFGDPVFKITDIVLEDGTKLNCEGEHDIAYIAAYGDGEKYFADEIIENIQKTDPNYEPDSE